MLGLLLEWDEGSGGLHGCRGVGCQVKVEDDVGNVGDLAAVVVVSSVIGHCAVVINTDMVLILLRLFSLGWLLLVSLTGCHIDLGHIEPTRCFVPSALIPCPI